MSSGGCDFDDDIESMLNQARSSRRGGGMVKIKMSGRGAERFGPQIEEFFGGRSGGARFEEIEEEPSSSGNKVKINVMEANFEAVSDEVLFYLEPKFIILYKEQKFESKPCCGDTRNRKWRDKEAKFKLQGNLSDAGVF